MFSSYSPVSRRWKSWTKRRTKTRPCVALSNDYSEALVGFNSSSISRRGSKRHTTRRGLVALSERHRLLRQLSADLNEQLLLLLSEEEASRFSSRRERTVRTLATLHPSSASSTGACSTTWSTRAKCHFEWAGVSSQCIFSFHLSSLLLFLFVYSSCNLLLRLRRRLHRELRSGGRVPRPQWPVLQLQWRARANAFRLVGRLERFEYKKPVLPSQDYYE